MPHWSLDDIPWQRFDATKVTPDMVSLVKAACLVEANASDYARYLCEVFKDDPEFQRDARIWAGEETQHGHALRAWAELADPSFDFDYSFRRFTEGYSLPQGMSQSVRGSSSGELIARCIVEIGTSSYYTAIKDAVCEPVLKAISAKIAADEFRHYKLFYTHLQRYLKIERIGLWRRLRIALSRITESEDDELAYAYHASHFQETEPYDRDRCVRLYRAAAYRFYRKPHIEKIVVMAFKAIGLKTSGLLNRAARRMAWEYFRWQGRSWDVLTE